MRLDIPSGTAVRFEPGDVKTVTLVSIAGHCVISGGNNFAPRVLDLARTDATTILKVQDGFSHVPEPGALEVSVDTIVSRQTYISMFGPTVGDRVRLGDTSLWVEVEWDTVCSRNLSYKMYLTGIPDHLWRRSQVWRRLVLF